MERTILAIIEYEQFYKYPEHAALSAGPKGAQHV